MSVTALRAEGVSSMFDGADPASLSDEVLEVRVLGYAAQITALTAEFLSLVAELDERESWRVRGIHSLAQWLSWKAGISQRTAHEQVRVAKSLRELPLIREAFGAGAVDVFEGAGVDAGGDSVAGAGVGESGVVVHGVAGGEGGAGDASDRSRAQREGGARGAGGVVGSVEVECRWVVVGVVDVVAVGWCAVPGGCGAGGV